MKTVILINEDFLEMRLGLNATLSYILAALDIDQEVYLINIENQLDAKDAFKARLIKKDGCQKLINSYKENNQNLLNPGQNSKKLVKDIEFQSQNVELDINDCDFLIQRLDPTHAPFPPHGKEDFRGFLNTLLKDKKIKNQNFQFPVDCFSDKELPLKMNLGIEIKSELSAIDDKDLVKKILQIKDFSKVEKLVLKPDNSGQSLGVFAIEFREDGHNLAGFLQQNLTEITGSQIYAIDKNCTEGSLQKILLLLLFCQAVKPEKDLTDKKMSELSDQEIDSGARNLYNNKIVIQPFIEGVSRGDIRINIAKIDHKFEVFGAVLRKAIESEDSNNFTTCVTSNMAKPCSIYGELSDMEIADLAEKTNKVTNSLNTDLAQQYEKCLEIGLDFILKGDGQTVLLNEANHDCPALLPIAEIIRKSDGAIGVYDKFKCRDFEYDGGLGMVKMLIKSWMQSSFKA